MTNTFKFLTMFSLALTGLASFGCDQDLVRESFRESEPMACWQICPPGEECVVTCVPIGPDSPGTSTDTGSDTGTDTGTDDTSIPMDTGTEDTAGPEVFPHPCCFKNEFDGCIHPSDKAIEACVGAIRPYCVGPDPENIGWHFKCVQEAIDSCGLVC